MNARLYEQPNKVEIIYRKRTIEREINFYLLIAFNQPNETRNSEPQDK